MDNAIKSLNEVLEKLPPDKQNKVFSFAKELLRKEESKSAGKMDLSWAGSLKKYRNQYTSLDLQKKALEWWGD